MGAGDWAPGGRLERGARRGRRGPAPCGGPGGGVGIVKPPKNSSDAAKMSTGRLLVFKGMGRGGDCGGEGDRYR